jgi:hypothetical protein
MSAERSPSNRSRAASDVAYRTSDMTQLRARRRDARRRRRLARVDLGLGVLVALVVLLVSAGLAIAGLISLVMLALCALSIVLERRRRARAVAGRPANVTRRSAIVATGGSRRAHDRAAQDQPRSTR